MVQRHGDTLEFDYTERFEFFAPNNASATEAVAMAVSFQAAAKKVRDRNLAELDSSNKAAVHDRLTRELQIGRLNAFATRILDLCPEEHSQLIAASDTDAKQ